MTGDMRTAVILRWARRRGVSRLQAFRENLGLSREGLAERCGLDVKSIAVCETHDGLARPAAQQRRRLSRCLGVEPDVLFGEPCARVFRARPPAKDGHPSPA